MRTPLALDRSVGGLGRRVLTVCFWIGLLLCFLGLVIGLQRGWAITTFFAGVGFLVGLYSGFIEPQWLQVVAYPLTLSDGMKRSLRIVFLSDFHTGEEKTRRFYNRLFKQVEELKPDLILLGGDFVECQSVSIGDLAGLATLKPRYGIHFVLGNHDYWDNPAFIRAALTSFGAQDLTGKTHLIGEGARAFVLTGIDDSWFGTPWEQLPLPPCDVPRIILTHESDILRDLPERSADLVFLGHTHGGQIRLPGYGTIKSLPQSTPQWLDRGLRAWRGMNLLISQGIGESGARVRFFARPQILVTDL